MLEGLIGQDNFYQIVKTYLTNFAFGNADMDDLLKTIDEVIEKHCFNLINFTLNNL